MTNRKPPYPRTAAIALAALAALAAPAWSADHREAPFVALDGRVDINDVYVFDASDPAKTVFIMTLNPNAGVVGGADFSDEARYEFLVDLNDDTRTDLRYEFRFGRPRSDGQRLQVRRVPTGGTPSVIATGFTGDDIQSGDFRVTADMFEDPFFFDLDAFLGVKGRAFCDGGEVDFFAGQNVLALVLEIPDSDIGASAFRVSGRTGLNGLQADRMGIPGIATAVIPSNPFETTEPNLKDAYNATEPRGDWSIWSEEVKDNLAIFYSDPMIIDAIADILLPDTLPFDSSVKPAFLNGRTLAEDVIDSLLPLLTNGVVPTDCVDGNDAEFSTEFPYLAPPN